MKRCSAYCCFFPALSIICLTLFFASLPVQASEYSHGSTQSSFWADSSAWTPAGVPGASDTANVYYSINLSSTSGSAISVGTLNLDTYNPSGPSGFIQLYGYTLNILDSGQWSWGGLSDYYGSTGVVNLYGTMQLVDDIADHYGNGPETVDLVAHPIDHGITLNNYGIMQHDSLGSFDLGASACQYVIHGIHNFTTDGDITTGGQGGERTTNYGTIVKSGGTGQSLINGELDNQGMVEAQSGTIFVGNSLQYDGYWSHELHSGQWTARDNASIVIAGRGELETNSGHIVLDGSGANFYTTQTYTYTPLEAYLTTNAGTLEIHGNRTFDRAVENSGTFIVGDDTTLTINLTNTGTFQVGNSPGHGTVNGEFAQSSTGEMLMELGGLIQGDEYDVFEVTGTATLAGTLNLSYLDDFTATPGDKFDILQADSIVGQFDDVLYPDAQNWMIDYDPTAGRVTVGVVPEPTTTCLLLILLALPLMRWHRH